MVQLTGGLGNQLFGLFFGLYVSHKNKLPLILDETIVPHGLTNHGSTLNSFNFSIPVISQTYKNGIFKKYLNRIIDKLYLESSLFKMLTIRFRRIYKSNVTGFDPEAVKIQGGFLAVGYFQSWKYVLDTIKLFPGRTLTLRNPSAWFEMTAKELLRVNPTVLHVRRGDLKIPHNPSGLLTADYYLNALDKLPACNVVWVFSDDIDESKKMFDIKSKYTFEFIQPPLNTDPAESMIVMSLSSQIIIANSTFSWWAAMFGEENKRVIAPIPFFKNIAEPLDFIPNDWLRQESKWED
jgi:hypothetical protein